MGGDVIPSRGTGRGKMSPFEDGDMDQRGWGASASPELVLVRLHDLALQFEGLFGKQLEVSDVVGGMLLRVVVPEFSWRQQPRQ